jgi:hypothetical protein
MYIGIAFAFPVFFCMHCGKVPSIAKEAKTAQGKQYLKPSRCTLVKMFLRKIFTSLHTFLMGNIQFHV